MRTARRLLQLGALGVAVAVVGGDLFELDRFLAPKELVLLVTAFGAAAAAFRATERPVLSLSDMGLAAWFGLSLLSALVAANGWLAVRALGVSAAGLACYWTARAIARNEMERPLLAALAMATIFAAVTALLQAYGLSLPLVSDRRAPGGLMGNRNFMAHLTAVGLPITLYLTITSRSRAGALMGGIGITLAAAALVLSRSRAAWLAVLVGATFLVVEGVLISGLWRDASVRRRLGTAVGGAIAGLALAIAVPNGLDWRSDNPYLESFTGMANFQEGSGRGRIVQWSNTLRMSADNFFLGVGPGNWMIEYPDYTTPNDPSFAWNDAIPTNPWPSSDWMGLLAERGWPAMACLLGVLGSLAFVGYRRSRRHGAAPEGLAGLAMVSLLLVTGIVAAFDAVLLLAAPTLVFWTALGALQPAPRVAASLDQSWQRRAVQWGLYAGAALWISRSAAETLSVVVAGDGGSRRTLRVASAIDPGSFRLQLRLAGIPGNAPCAQVRVHAARAAELMPNHRVPKQALRRCR